MWSITDSSDWQVSEALLVKLAPVVRGWPSGLADHELFAWRRLLGWYAPFLWAEGYRRGRPNPCLDAIEERIVALEREARKRPRLRNLSLVREHKTTEQMTRPTKKAGSWRSKRGRKPALKSVDNNAILIGHRRGLSVTSMTRALALGLKPASDRDPDLDSWIRSVEGVRRFRGRPRRGGVQLAAPNPEEVARYKRLIERTLQISREMDRVVAAGLRIRRLWPVPFKPPR